MCIVLKLLIPFLFILLCSISHQNCPTGGQAAYKFNKNINKQQQINYFMKSTLITRSNSDSSNMDHIMLRLLAKERYSKYFQLRAIVIILQRLFLLSWIIRGHQRAFLMPPISIKPLDVLSFLRLDEMALACNFLPLRMALTVSP